MRRPRATCPYCLRTVAVTTGDQLYSHHTRRGTPCRGRRPDLPIRNAIRSL